MKTMTPEQAGLDPEVLAGLDKLIGPRIGNDAARKQIPGLGVRVIRKGAAVYDRYFGFKDAEASSPMSEDTIMYLYSMTKPVTAVAALKLFERGEFTLNTPLKEFIPAFSSMNVLKTLEGDAMDTVVAKTDITVKHLFTMTSGIAYGLRPDSDKLDALVASLFRPGPDGALMDTAEDPIAEVASFPLAFEPGTDYRYGLSHDVLGRVIEIVSGMRLSEFMQKEIFDPLGMKDTGFGITGAQLPRLAKIYRYDGEAREHWPGLVNPTDEGAFESGGGGLVSTAEDYSRFLAMLAAGGAYEGERILGRKTVALMARNHLNEKALASFRRGAEGYGYGLGVRTLMDPAAAGMNGSVGEFGWSGMAGTWMMVDPAEDLSFLFMIQAFPSDYFDLRRKCVQIAYSALK